MNKDYPILVHPGETLAENLEFLNISQKNLSIRTGISEKHISQIINGIASITPETALKLERSLGIKATFWNNLETNYREKLARIEQEKSLKDEEAHLSNFPCYNDLAKLGYVKKTRVRRERVISLLDFFKVNSLASVPLSMGVNYRTTGSEAVQQNDFCLAAWIRCGQLEAEKAQVTEYNEKKLKNNLRILRSLTKEDFFEEKLKMLCAEAGVTVVFLPKFTKTKINGATYWFKNKPVVQLNNKGKKHDILWFTFFHELGHIILKHGKKNIFIETDKPTDEKEREANEFAEELLIPSKVYKEWKLKVNLKKLEPNELKEAVIQFANKLDVGPHIVAGRIGHNDDLHWSEVTNLRKSLELSLP